LKLPLTFYTSDDVLSIAQNLLGKYLFTAIDGLITGGYIVESEAYYGVFDKASHAYGNKLTPRTSTMFEQGGIAYVYLCYGIHEMLNVVTSVKGRPHAVLLRAIEPVEGLDIMLTRRKMAQFKQTITSGPGSLAKALGVDRKLNGASLLGEQIWIEDLGLRFEKEQIAAVPRVGVGYAGEDALLPYRFFVKGNKFVSKPNK
jgi:DNA-3-methyladenine glycosylase